MTKTNRRMARQPAETESLAAPVADAAINACTVTPKATSKIAKVIALLQRDEGATLDDIEAATGWQKHTVRASLTGLKKKGHSIEKTTRDDVTCYRIGADS
jgi:hypothetical protein